MTRAHIRSAAVLLIAALLVGLGIARAPTADAAESGPYTPPTTSLNAALASGRVQKETVDLLQRTSRAPVIVRLNLPSPFRPEGTIPSLVDDQRRQIAAAQDALLKKLTGHRVDHVKRFHTIPHLALELDMRALLAVIALPEVALVHPDSLRAPSLNTSTVTVGANRVRNAIGIANAGRGQTVAILDSGVAANHAFLGGRVVSEACYSTDSGTLDAVCPGSDAEESTAAGSGRPCPLTSLCDHGTNVAGIAAGDGTGVTGAPISGIASAANIIAIEVFSTENSNANCNATLQPTPCILARDSDVIRGLERVYDLRNTFSIAAANLSLASGFFTNQRTCDDQLSDYKDIADNLRSRKIATVAASGNDAAPTPGTFMAGVAAPACVSSIISVGRTQGSGTTESVFSTSQTGTLLDLLAPGTGIRTSVLPVSSFLPQNGTSMAAPHVTGAFAVLRSLLPNQSVDTYLNVLTSTGTPITGTRGGLNIVTPRLQLDAAVESLLGKPLAPSNARVGTAISGRKLTVFWTDNSRSETQFKVEYHGEFAFGWQSVTTGANVGQATVEGLSNDSAYTFRVSACDANNKCSLPSNEALGRTLDTIPSAPNLQTGNVGPTSIQLVWSPTSNNHVGYKLRTDAQSQQLNNFATYTYGAASSGTTFNVAHYGWEYHFYLSACGIDGDCGDETYLPVTTPLPPGTPSNLHVAGVTQSTSAGVTTDNFALQWTNNATGVVGWDIEWWRGSIWVLNPQPVQWQRQHINVIVPILPGPPGPPTVGLNSVSANVAISPAGSTGGFVVFRVRAVTAAGPSDYSLEHWYFYP